MTMYLLPWEPCEGPGPSNESDVGRKAFNGDYDWEVLVYLAPSELEPDETSAWYAWFEDDMRLGSHGSFASREEAMKYADLVMLNEGYYLIPENEVERFKEKLSLLI